MQQIQVKKNTLSIEVFIEEVDISQIPDTELTLIASDLELEIFAMVEKKHKRKKYKNKNAT